MNVKVLFIYSISFLAILITIPSLAFGETIDYTVTSTGANVTLPCTALSNAHDDCQEITGIIQENDASLTLRFTTNSDSRSLGYLNLDVPRDALDSKLNNADSEFFVFVDGEHIENFQHTSDLVSRSMIIPIPPGSTEVEIIGSVAVPEFSLIIPMMFIVFSILIFVTRTRISKQFTI